MRVLRTPDERFENLADYPFAPHYVEVVDPAEGTRLRVHYVDEGPRDAAPIVLMHGEPTWSYLYRAMISGLVALGHRVVAPDLIGFGRSDKPSEPSDYTYERHVAWMQAWLDVLGASAITLFCQDWGGLIGLRLVAAQPERFARVIAANTGLPVGTGLTPAFENWLKFSQSVPELPIAQIVALGTVRKLGDAEQAAYLAPFPDESFKAGARRFPALVPVTPEHASVAENRAAWLELAKFTKPFLTAFSDADPITKGGEAILQAKIPGAKGQPHVTIERGGHFLQEDQPGELVAQIDRFVRTTR